MQTPLPSDQVPPMVAVDAGSITLKDEGTGVSWTVGIGRFEIAAWPVTAGLLAAAVDGRATAGTASLDPATDVSWIDAIRFCNRLSIRQGLEPCYAYGDDPDALSVTWDHSATGFRLPTEAEWEYACRAGDVGVRYGTLDEIGWYVGNSAGRAHPVATRRANAWGLYDTIGNAWEWCWDLFDPDRYGPYRVFRGGGWNDSPRSCRASCRRKSHPTLRLDDLGFRVARSAPAR